MSKFNLGTCTTPVYAVELRMQLPDICSKFFPRRRNYVHSVKNKCIQVRTKVLINIYICRY